MPEFVIWAVAEIGAFIGSELGAALIMNSVAIGNTVFFATTLVYGQVSARNAAKRAARGARDAYNASLTDRTVTLLSANAPWQVIYGEPVVGGQYVATLTSGDKDQFKHVVVVWAAHECEAITDFLLAGVSVGPLDSNGYVTTGKWMKGETQTDTVNITFDSSGVATLPEAGLAVVSVTPSWGDSTDSRFDRLEDFQVTVVGTTLTVTAGLVFMWADRDAVVTFNRASGSAMLRVRHHLGSPTQTADMALMADCPADWTATDRLQGLCYSVITFNLNEPEFQGGPLQPTAKIKGKRIYDHRTGLTAWSPNPVLCTADFLVAEYGKRALTTQLIWTSFDSSANVCDEALASHGGAARYTCHGAFRTDQDPDATLDQLLQSFAGFATYNGGWHVQAGAYTAPVMALTDADNRGSVEIIAAPQGDEVFNSLRGSFFDPSRFDQLTDYSPYSNAAFVTEDGAPLWADLNLPFTDSAWRAHNLARIQVERSRGMQLVYPAKRRALKLRVGQRVTLTNPLLGMEAAIFRVVKREYQLGRAVMLTLAQDDPSMYDEVDAPASLPSPSAHLPSPFVVGAPVGLAASSGNATLVKLEDGTVLGRLKLTYTGSTDAYVVSNGALQIEYRRDDSTTWQRAPEAAGNSTEAYLMGLAEGHVFVVRARWRNALGANSDWRAATMLHTGKSAPPSDVADLTAMAVPGGLRYAWTKCPDLDYRDTELLVSDTLLLADAVLVWTGSGSEHTWPEALDGTHYKAWVRHFDSSDNPSATATVVELDYSAVIVGSDLMLQASSQIFAVNSAGVASPATITFTALHVGIGTLVFDVPAGTATLTGSGSTRSLAYADLTTDSATIRVTQGAYSDMVTVVKLRDGSASLVGMLSNESASVAATSAGVVGSFSGTGGTFRVFRGLLDLTGDVSVTYSVYSSSGVTIGIDSAGVYTISGLSTDTGTATLRAVCAGITLDKIYSISKSKAGTNGTNGTNGSNGSNGYNGSDGLNSATVYIYQRSSSGAPALPSATANYTFSSSTVTGLNNGWSATIPGGTALLYVSAAAAVSSGTSDNISPGEWAAAQLMAQDGLNSATVFLYYRSNFSIGSVTAPAGTLTYTFSSGVISGASLAPWTQTVPAASAGKYLYVITATALSTSPTDTITSGEWSAVRVMAQDGSRGTVNVAWAVPSSGYIWNWGGGGSGGPADTAASAAVSSATGGDTPKAYDIVTLYVSGTNYSETRFLHPTAGFGWVAIDAYLSTRQLMANAATEVYQDAYYFGGGGFGNYTPRSFTVTPSDNCNIELTATISADNCYNDGGNSIAWKTTPAGGGTTTQMVTQNNDLIRRDFAFMSLFSATGGVPITFDLVTNNFGGGPSIHLWHSKIRIVMVKR